MGKTERLQIRLSAEDKKRMEQKARQEGRSLSNYVINCCINGKAETSHALDKKSVLKSVIHMEDILNAWKRSADHKDISTTIKQLEQEADSLWQSLK